MAMIATTYVNGYEPRCRNCDHPRRLHCSTAYSMFAPTGSCVVCTCDEYDAPVVATRRHWLDGPVRVLVEALERQGRLNDETSAQIDAAYQAEQTWANELGVEDLNLMLQQGRPAHLLDPVAIELDVGRGARGWPWFKRVSPLGRAIDRFRLRLSLWWLEIRWMHVRRGAP